MCVTYISSALLRACEYTLTDICRESNFYPPVLSQTRGRTQTESDAKCSETDYGPTPETEETFVSDTQTLHKYDSVRGNLTLTV